MMAPVAQLSIERPEPSVAVVVFAGEHDLTSAKHATRIFEDLVAEGTSIVADLSQVLFLDTTVIHALVVGRNLAEASDVGFATCLPDGNVARRMLELMRVLEVFPAATEVDDAIAAARAASARR
jgi:anti-anti-sigma regulatory factor